jgi:hypothetical protein
MLQTIVLCFLAGVMGANGIPHFVRGIAAQEYPAMIGNSPVRNVVAGWAGLVIAGLLVFWSAADRHPTAAFVATAFGALVLALFHARGGAFRLNTRYGRVNPQS